MPSLKSRIVAFVLRRTRKKAFSSAAALRARIRIERAHEDYRPPSRLRRRLAIRRRRIAGMPVFEVKPKGRPRNWPGSVRIIYMHGGAYLFQITPYHWQMVAEMAERLDARITVPIYPLAPETKVERTFRKMLGFYRRLLHETPPEHLVFMGDSAGAHMAVVLTMLSARQDLPGPSRQVLISPGLDMSLANPRLRELEKVDPWLAVDGGLEALRLCAPDMDPADWRISPIYGDLSVLPKTLILTGSLDLLSADAAIFAEKAREAGVQVEFVLEEGMMHVWPLIDMPEARHARNRIVAFLTDGEQQPMPGAVALLAAILSGLCRTGFRSGRALLRNWARAVGHALRAPGTVRAGRSANAEGLRSGPTP